MRHQQEIQYIMHLLKCAVTDEIPQLPPEDLDWELIFNVAKKHKIVSTLYFGMVKFPQDMQKTIPHINDYIFSYQKNLVSDANRSFELERLKTAFSDNNIDYMLLKGSIIKHYYPDTSIRRMNDIDILFRGADFKTIDRIFKEFEYHILHKDAKDTAYIHPANRVIVEMQPHLIDIGYLKWYQYLENIWNKCNHSGNEYQMTLEDFYIYHIIHMAKHFINGGIGLTHVTDVYVMIQKFTGIDWDYVDAELSKLDLYQFNHTIKMLVEYWFDAVSSKDFSQKGIEIITFYILTGGAFGSTKQKEINSIVSRGDKSLSLRKKIFPDRTTMINYYGEFLNKHKCLLPYYWFRLNLTRLLHYNKDTKKNLTNISSITESEISTTEKIMKLCGLK